MPDHTLAIEMLDEMVSEVEYIKLRAHLETTANK